MPCVTCSTHDCVASADGSASRITVRFDVYGRFELEVVRAGAGWAVYRLDSGRRRRLADIVIPPDIDADDVRRYLDDLLHELAEPGRIVRRIG